MFLFSTSSARETTPANPVVTAIKQGADRTGTDFDYLLKTAQRESSLTPEAKARTSSATGLFQFIEQTWLSIVRQEGPKQGLSAYAEAISDSGNGRLTVADPRMREAILQLRNDPKVSAVMAGALTQRNGEQLAATLGRQPHAGELYIAHVLGARGASDLIRTAGSDPDRAAARDFPEAASANRSIFFDKSGQPRSVRQVYALLASSHAGTQVAAASVQSAQTAQSAEPPPVPIAAALAPGRAKGLIGLFSTEGSRQPVSSAVANLWTTPRSGVASRQGAEEGASRYFPRLDGTASTAPAAAQEGAASPAPVSVVAPLPPGRPRDLDKPTPAQAEVAGRPTARSRRAPLDLSAFMTTGRRG
jgi:hypothetical protein